MPRRIIYFILSIALFSCEPAEERTCFKSKGPVTVETRTLGTFDALRLFDGPRYELIQDSLDMVVLSGGEHMLPQVVTEIQDGALIIRDDNKCTWLRKLPEDIVVEIHYTSLSLIYNEAHGELVHTGTHRGDELYLESWHVNTRMTLDVEVDLLVASVNGGGTVTTLTGSSSAVYYHLDGLGVINGYGLDGDYYWANNLNTGQIRLQFFDGGEFDYLLDSYGDIYYRGEAEISREVSRLGEGRLIAD